MYNPILPLDSFIPDGEPKVFGDRIYLYGSHDLPSDKNLCGGDYETWSIGVEEFLDCVDGKIQGNLWKNEGVIYGREMQDVHRHAKSR